MKRINKRYGIVSHFNEVFLITCIFQCSTMTSDQNRLKQRLFEEIEYTIYDDVVTQLLNITICPILQESSDNNVFVHNQLYDKVAWERHVRTQEEDNVSGVRRGTRRHGDTNHIKIPHTGKNLSVTEALSKVFDRINRRK